jgi:hypothetical protein
VGDGHGLVSDLRQRAWVGDDGSAASVTTEACVRDSGGATQGRAMVEARAAVEARHFQFCIAWK